MQHILAQNLWENLGNSFNGIPTNGNQNNAVDIKTIFSPANSFPTLGSFVSMFLKNSLAIAGVILFVFIIIGGFGVVTAAGGDAKKLEQGKKTITAAITGLLLIIAAYWIIQIVQQITGINILDSGL